MARGDRERWDERYRDVEFSLPDEPTGLLRRAINDLPDGRALDVATGRGRNARFLAGQGYEVDAVDVSGEALAQAREQAADRGVEVNWVLADVDEFPFPKAAYDVVTVAFFDARHRLDDLKRSLAPGGVLCYEHHLKSTDRIDRGPSTDRYRFGSNELLDACRDLTVLHYEERTRLDEGERSADVTLLARNSEGEAQSYPRFE